MAEPRAAKDRELRLATVKGVLDLMETAGTPQVDSDAIIPNGNGYSCWFIAQGQTGTAPLSAEDILDRIEARELVSWWGEDEHTPGPGEDWYCRCREPAPDRIGTVAVLRPGRISRCSVCFMDAPWAGAR